jgi:hypothetical protein
VKSPENYTRQKQNPASKFEEKSKTEDLREQIETEENISQQKTKEHKPPISHNFG